MAFYMKSLSSAESARTREPFVLESPPNSPIIRVKVFNAVMGSSSPSLPVDTPTEGSTTLRDSSFASASSIKSAPSAVPKFTIIGPLTPQFMEISDSSEGSSKYSERSILSIRSKAPMKSHIRRRASTSQLLEPYPGRRHITPASSPVRSVRSYTGVLIRSAADTEDEVDWVAYEREDPELDLHTELGNGSILSEGQGDTDPPAFVCGQKSEGRRDSVDPAVITQLLQDWLSPPPLLSQTISHRASKRSGLPPMLSLPASPTDNIRAVDRSLSQAASDDHDSRSMTESGSESSVPGRSCRACGRKKSIGKWMRVIPCNHVACSTCFSASISAVSVSRNPAQCPHCSEVIHTFAPLDGTNAVPIAALTPPHPRVNHVLQPAGDESVYPVLRIDNVAWDITPQIVKDYLPAGVLPDGHPAPIHIPLDRTDGRTKDYMYIEVANEDAARKVLKTRQNSLMPGGPLTCGRKRPVTITAVHPSQLIDELRPRCAAELHGSLALCQAAVSCPQLTRPSYTPSTSIVAPTGLAHFVKSRYGPFYAVMSILTKLRGRDSPAYWDIFHLSSGAIKALATASQLPGDRFLSLQELSLKTQDEAVLDQLSRLFHATFRSFTGGS